jgi:hypothetical protein
MTAGTFRACRAAALLKFLRDQWATEKEIRVGLLWGKNTVWIWLRELADNGILVQRTRTFDEDHRVRGYAPKEYALAPEWGGKVE